jgi:hypothetical protein
VVVVSQGGGSKSPGAAAAQVHNSKSSTTSSTTSSHQSGMPGSMSSSSTTSSTSSMVAGVRLMHLATIANQNPYSKGLLPPSTCTSGGPTVLTCMRPSSAVSMVRFQTYSSLAALYSAYEKQFQVLLGSPFHQNFRNCEQDASYGEVSWNHSSQHSKNYLVSQMEAGRVNDNLAFGRVFCGFNPSGDAFHIAWTNDADRMLGVATGAAHDTTWIWWHHVHHTFQSGASDMSGMSNMSG